MVYSFDDYTVNHVTLRVQSILLYNAIGSFKTLLYRKSRNEFVFLFILLLFAFTIVIYSHIPEANHVSGLRSVVAIL